VDNPNVFYNGPAQVVRQVGQYGIKVSFWGSGTLKIVILVENHPPQNMQNAETTFSVGLL
jgi:hypothetical protein